MHHFLVSGSPAGERDREIERGRDRERERQRERMKERDREIELLSLKALLDADPFFYKTR